MQKIAKDFSGEVFYLPDESITTSQIISPKYWTETSKSRLGKHCIEDAPMSAEYRRLLFNSQIIVAGENFGCGLACEQAPWALEGAGIRCVVAPSFGRVFDNNVFENNMFANGLLCITLSKDLIDSMFATKPKAIKIDWESGSVDGLKWFELSDYQKNLIRNGGIGTK